MNHPIGQLVVVIQYAPSRLTVRQVHGWVDQMSIMPVVLLITLLLSGCAEETDQNLRSNQSDLEKVTRLAGAGDPLAQNKLGLIYYLGENVEQDSNKALEWYGKAAEQEFADAQYNLGVMYKDGRGVEKNLIEAYAWYNLALAFGDKDAQSERDGLGLKDGEISQARVLSSEIYQMIVAQRGN